MKQPAIMLAVFIIISRHSERSKETNKNHSSSKEANFPPHWGGLRWGQKTNYN
jgi:hypothetical protein